MKLQVLICFTLVNCSSAKQANNRSGYGPVKIEPATVLIPGGQFMMGSVEGEDDEVPVHPVSLDSFYLAKYETTNAQFCQFLNEQGNQSQDGTAWINLTGNWNGEKCRILQQGNQFQVEPGYEDYPVVYVSWDGASAYSRWLNKKTGRPYRLPTEAEWEFAAGNGSRHTRYSWGNDPPSSSRGGNVADESLKQKFSQWTIFPGYDDAWVFNAPVGRFSPNDFGLFDMTGNVWEWCSDWFGSYDSATALNPIGPPNGKTKVIRGGGWLGSPQACRVTDRYADKPEHRGHSMGFRVAISVR